MKSLKIVNSFIFIFVINLSITFLYKNNLFTTFINEVLQTNHKNLWKRKKRSLSEMKLLNLNDISNNLSSEDYDYIKCFINIELNAFLHMLPHIKSLSCTLEDELFVCKLIYLNGYYHNFINQNIDLSYDDMIKSFERLRNHTFVNSLNYSLINHNLYLLKMIKTEHKLVKSLLIFYFNEYNQDFREKILNPEFIMELVKIYPLSVDGIYNESLHEMVESILSLSTHIINKLSASKAS